MFATLRLGFLLVFRTDWAYDRYYEGKKSMGELYSGLRNLNVCFVNYLRENKSGVGLCKSNAVCSSPIAGNRLILTLQSIK